SLVVTRSVLAPEDRRASTLPLIPGSLAELPRAVGITRLLISRPPLRRVLLTLVHHHVASGEDPARGPDHHPVGSLRDLLPRAVGRVPRLLPAGPPGRLEEGTLVSHPVTGRIGLICGPLRFTRLRCACQWRDSDLIDDRRPLRPQCKVGPDVGSIGLPVEVRRLLRTDR